MGRRDSSLVRHRHLVKAGGVVRAYLPPLNFITIHYAYFICVCLVSSVIFWGSSDPKYSISYVDSLFLVISAMTEAGLNTVNLSQMTTWQQVHLALLIMLGSTIWVSIWTVLARKRAFELRFEDIVRRSRLRRPRTVAEKRPMAELPIMSAIRSLGRARTPSGPKEEDGRDGERRIGARDGGVGSTISGPVSARRMSRLVPRDDDVEAGTSPVDGDSHLGMEPYTVSIGRTDSKGMEHIAFAEDVDSPREKGASTAVTDGTGMVRRYAHGNDGDDGARSTSPPGDAGPLRHPHFLTPKTVGRNAQFHGLSREEREQLGGTEYRALKILSIVVPTYFFLCQLLGCLALGAWIANNQPQPALPWWNGVFNAVSAFNNSGMSVLDLNMIPYGGSYFVLLSMGFLILAGNTAYPVFLRLWLWSMWKLLKLLTYETDHLELKLTLDYILKYPRRVYTNLFPSRTTWWLAFMLLVLNGTDWIGFEVLNIGNPAVESIPVGNRIVDGLFQALAVRSGGFYVISIPSLYIGIQVLYVIMMYVSVYPVVITMRHSNVYEERSLGIYKDDPESGTTVPGHRPVTPASSKQRRPSLIMTRALRRSLSEWHGVGAARPSGDDEAESRVSFISQQIRGQLSHDLWLLVLAVFLIAVIETRHFLNDPVSFSVFNVLFEVVSAYGTVGISVGVPNNAYSFSGGWYTGSKLVLCLVMLRGRHRGLPVALDRAVRLPGEDLSRDEEEDHFIRRSISHVEG